MLNNDEYIYGACDERCQCEPRARMTNTRGNRSRGYNSDRRTHAIPHVAIHTRRHTHHNKLHCNWYMVVRRLLVFVGTYIPIRSPMRERLVSWPTRQINDITKWLRPYGDTNWQDKANANANLKTLAKTRANLCDGTSVQYIQKANHNAHEALAQVTIHGQAYNVRKEAQWQCEWYGSINPRASDSYRAMKMHLTI